MDIDDRQIRRLEKQINLLSDHAIPIAIQQTLNNVARKAWREGRRNTDREFQNRNTYSKRSQTYQQTRELDIDKMVAIAGSSAQYLAEQETGFTRTSKSGGVWVPTAEAADQSGQTRTKPIKAKFRRSRIRMAKPKTKRPVSAKQAHFFKLINAVRSRSGYFFGEFKNTKGMWKIEGSLDTGRLVLTGVRLLYSATRRTVYTPKTAWHSEGVDVANRDLEGEYYRALKRQFARLKRKYK